MKPFVFQHGDGLWKPGTSLLHVYPAAVGYPWGVQDLTVAYAHADSDAAQRILRRVRPSHAPLHVEAVHLVDVTADAQAKTVTWQHLAAIPLGGNASVDPSPSP